MRDRPSLLGIIYLIVGVIVAANDKYFKGIGTIEEVVEAILAVALWPLVLLGIDMRF